MKTRDSGIGGRSLWLAVGCLVVLSALFGYVVGHWVWIWNEAESLGRVDANLVSTPNQANERWRSREMDSASRGRELQRGSSPVLTMYALSSGPPEFGSCFVDVVSTDYVGSADMVKTDGLKDILRLLDLGRVPHSVTQSIVVLSREGALRAHERGLPAGTEPPPFSSYPQQLSELVAVEDIVAILTLSGGDMDMAGSEKAIQVELEALDDLFSSATPHSSR